MIRVLVAEDHAMVRGALIALLELEPDVEVIGEVGSGHEVVAAALSTRPDIALVDVEMPGYSGIEVTEHLAKSLPSCHVVILTGFEKPGVLQRAIKAGARGFLLKSAHSSKLGNALRRIAAGEMVVDDQLAAQALAGGDCPLSERQLDILRSGADGRPVSEIAANLNLAPGTVKNYISSIIAQLGVRNRAEAVAQATAQGWL